MEPEQCSRIPFLCTAHPSRNMFVFNDLSRIDITSKASYEASKDGMVTYPVGSGP